MLEDATKYEFQPLIGTIKTLIELNETQKLDRVSTPYRDDKNYFGKLTTDKGKLKCFNPL